MTGWSRCRLSDHLAHEHADIDVDRVHEYRQNLEQSHAFAREIASFIEAYD